jgi:hypothetical protein
MKTLYYLLIRLFSSDFQVNSFPVREINGIGDPHDE